MTSMLLLLIITSSILSKVAAQANITELCQKPPTSADTQGGNSIYLDADLNFVYSTKHCRSDSQRLVDPNWYNSACGYAIAAACGILAIKTTTAYPSPGQWTSGWHSDLTGATCQASLYLPGQVAGDTDPDHYLNFDCCRRNFGAAQLGIAQNLVGVDLDATSFNRASINIAPSGFPYTKAFQDQSDQLIFTGMQINSGWPSYILQA